VTGVFALFLVRTSVGLLFALLFVPEKAGERFFKLCSAVAAFMLTAVVLLSLERNGARGPFFWGTAGCLAFAVLFNRAWHFSWRRTLLLPCAVALGFLAFLGASSPSGLLFSLATDLSSSVLLGAAAAAMILGHYYLVVLDLPTSALKRLTVLLCLSLALRGLVVGSALFGGAGLLQATDVVRGVFDLDGVFVWMRVLFGLAGPASLLWFIWKTVEIRSTQSATGILYVQLFLVLSGELLATYLRVVVGLSL
jgi:hypothetical protein